MEKKTAGLLTAKFLEMLHDLGVDPREFAVEMGKHLTGKSPTKGERSLVVRSFQKTFNDPMQAWLEEYREPSQQELTQILIRLKTAAPEMRKILMETARKIPTKAGGRPRELAANNAEARLCTLISQQLADGTEKPEAIQDAASRFGVSYWTAKRAWKRYQQAAKETRRHPRKKAQRTIRRRRRARRARPRSIAPDKARRSTPPVHLRRAAP